MARSLRQIQQELDQIKATVSDVAQELQTLYEQYIQLLSESAQKQLVLASYQVCTQIYPEAFLKISLSQRQQLQQAVRKLGQEIKPVLEKKVTGEELSQEQADLSLIAEMLKNLPLGKSSDRENPAYGDRHKSSPTKEQTFPTAEDLEEELPEEELDSPTTIILGQDDDLVVGEVQEFSLEKLQQLAEQEPKTPKIKEIDFSNPQHLVLWHKIIETRIRKTLDNTSRQANKQLQNSGIIPGRLPSKVMEVALQAGGNSSGNSKLRSIPNILNLTIETEKGKKPSQSGFSQVSLLRLRLSEIEFADPQLSSQRNLIRVLVKKAKKLESFFQDKQHEYAQAEADAAWRSSWYED